MPAKLPSLFARSFCLRCFCLIVSLLLPTTVFAADTAQNNAVNGQGITSEEAQKREVANRLGGYLCGIITNPTNDLEKEIFPAVKWIMKRHGINNNASDVDVVRYLNDNKHDLICPDTGRNFMTVAIDVQVATTLLQLTFSYNIRDLKDENGNKVSIDFNGIYLNENGEPQTLMNYIQNSMKSDRYSWFTKKKI